MPLCLHDRHRVCMYAAVLACRCRSGTRAAGCARRRSTATSTRATPSRFRSWALSSRPQTRMGSSSCECFACFRLCFCRWCVFVPCALGLLSLVWPPWLRVCAVACVQGHGWGVSVMLWLTAQSSTHADYVLLCRISACRWDVRMVAEIMTIPTGKHPANKAAFDRSAQVREPIYVPNVRVCLCVACCMVLWLHHCMQAYVMVCAGNDCLCLACRCLWEHAAEHQQQSLAAWCGP